MKPSNNVASTGGYDSDIEIVEQPELDDDEPPSDDETRLDIDLPTNSMLPVDQSTPIRPKPIKANLIVTPKAKPLSPIAANGNANQTREIFVKPKSPLRSTAAATPVRNGSSNGSEDKQPPEIPSGSFYGKKNANAKNLKRAPAKSLAPQPPPPPPCTPKRPRRASALVARGNIRKTAENAPFDFDENENGEVELKPKRKKAAATVAAKAQPKKPRRAKKVPDPPKWPELNIKVGNGKKGPRQLYPIEMDMNDADDFDPTAPKTPKLSKRAPSLTSSELTPANFKPTSDPEIQTKRFFDNAMKINERAQKKQQIDNLNASFSYRRAMDKNKHQKPSNVIFSQADSTNLDAVGDF